MKHLTQQEMLNFKERIKCANYVATLKEIMRDLLESCTNYEQTSAITDLAVKRRQVLLDEHVDDPLCGLHFTNG